jgi:tetratricopeptide (TPR) repeat protein
MAFDKAKTLRAAEKHLELGKIPAAIKEYCQIVDHEPDDFTTLNMLGDLYVRVGDNEEAISSFARIAEHYRDQQFALKAIAMYKKIDRLRPNNIEIALTLAQLYAQQDLVVEARAHYLLVAEAYNRANDTQKALAVLGQIVDLDPQNTDTRIKLAEAFLREGMAEEAVASFAESGERLLARGAFERALEAYARSLEINPADHASLRGLLATHNARGTPDEAAEAIERAAANNPDDPELLSMLATAYVEAEQPAEAERVVAALVAKDSFSYLKYVDVARLYLKTDKLEDALRVMEDIGERMLAGREDNQLLELISEVLAVDSDNVRTLRLLVRVYWNQRERDELKAALERLAEAAEAAGLKRDEGYALTQLTRLFPEETHYAERLDKVGGVDQEAAAEALPIFEGASQPAIFATVESAEDEFQEPSQRDFLPESSEGAPEWNQVGSGPEFSGNGAGVTPGEFEIGFDAVVAAEVAAEYSVSGQSGAASSIDSERSAIRARELESVDFYIAQGYADIALDTLNLLENQFGPHEAINTRRERIKLLPQPSPATSAEGPATDGPGEEDFQEVDFVIPAEEPSAPGPEVSEVSMFSAVEPGSQPAETAIDAGLAEVFEEFRLSAEADAGTNGDYETHYNMGLAYKEMDLMEDAVKEFQTAVKLVHPSDGTPRYLQCCNLLGHCFLQQGVPRLAVAWFNKGLAAPGHSDEEYQALRFDLGSAYEEMGDVTRALEIFTEIYGTNISYRGVNEKLRKLQGIAGAPEGTHKSV